MKRFLLTGLLILGLGQFATYAQQRGNYNDDIYYNSKDAKKDADAQKQRAAEAAAARQAARAQEEQERENTYSSSGGDADNSGDAATYRRSYASDADGDGYMDANDDYYYSSRVRRFGYYSSPGFGYYSPFYDPLWYGGPGFYGPGYYGSGVTVTIGYGWGPSWGYGYGPGWGYPYYGWGYPYGYGWGYPYGGYGWGYPYGGGGYWAGYNHGFYDGYHYGGGGYGAPRSVYGPRNSVSSNSYGPRTNRGTMPSAGGPIRQQRMSAPDNGNTAISNDPPRPVMRSTRVLPDNSVQDPGNTSVERRSRRFEPSEPAAQQQMPDRSMQRSRIFGGGQRTQMENSRRFEQREQPSIEQRQQRSYEPQRYQKSAPSRMQSSPGMSPGRSSGGSFGGGSFGSGGGGGRRR